MRLFVAIDIEDEIRERIAEYVSTLRQLEPDVRWVATESLHVTLKFIGEFPEQQRSELDRALEGVGGHPFQMTFRGAGFFTPRSPRVFSIGVEAGHELVALATAVETAVETLGVRREDHAFRPHLTLARIGSGRPQGSARDRRKPRMMELRSRVEMAAPPDFGTMTAREYFLYESKLSPGGARYTKIARFGLQ